MAAPDPLAAYAARLRAMPWEELRAEVDRLSPTLESILDPSPEYRAASGEMTGRPEWGAIDKSFRDALGRAAKDTEHSPYWQEAFQ